MAELVKPGGRRRLDRVLAPKFTEDLGSLDEDEVRSRRDLSRAERDYLSLVRRLLQGRLDILTAERERRKSGKPGSLVDDLPAILSDGPRGRSRGEAVLVSVPDAEVGRARRQVEQLASDARLSNLPDLSEEELDAAVDRLDEEERKVSDARLAVIDVHDAFQAELKRRYRKRYRSAE